MEGWENMWVGASQVDDTWSVSPGEGKMDVDDRCVEKGKG